MIGGTAVHMVEQPKKKPRAAMVRPVRKPTPPAAPLPCEPMMIQAPVTAGAEPGQASRPTAYAAMMPIGGFSPIPAPSSSLDPAPTAPDDGGRQPAPPIEVSEPGALALLGSGLLGLAARRWAGRRRS